MNSITVTCPHCKKSPLQVPYELVGRQLNCPHCNGKFTVSESYAIAAATAETKRQAATSRNVTIGIVLFIIGFLISIGACSL